MAISERDVQNSFELHLKELLTKFDAEISVSEDGEVEVFIARDRQIDRPEVTFTKRVFRGKSEGDLDW